MEPNVLKFCCMCYKPFSTNIRQTQISVYMGLLIQTNLSEKLPSNLAKHGRAIIYDFSNLFCQFPISLFPEMSVATLNVALTRNVAHPLFSGSGIRTPDPVNRHSIVYHKTNGRIDSLWYFSYCYLDHNLN